MIEALVFASIFTGAFGVVYWKFKKLFAPQISESAASGEPTNDEIRKSPEYRAWRDTIYKRDKWCIFCHSLKDLEAHHLYSFAGFPELRFTESNAILLCRKCHQLTPNYGSKQKEFDKRLKGI